MLVTIFSSNDHGEVVSHYFNSLYHALHPVRFSTDESRTAQLYAVALCEPLEFFHMHCHQLYMQSERQRFAVNDTAALPRLADDDRFRERLLCDIGKVFEVVLFLESTNNRINLVVRNQTNNAPT